MTKVKKTVQTAPNGAKMITVDLNQRSEEWLEWRAQGITASDIPILLGLSPYKTPWQLWAEKVGRINPPDLSKNPNVQRGNRLEDDARQLAEKRYNDVMLPVCGEYFEWDVFRASFDGLDTNHVSNEFKAPSESVWNDVAENGVESATYKLYESQVHAQCVVAGHTEGRLIFYKEDGSDMDFPVTLTDERKAEIIQSAKDFWELVKTKTPPTPDPEKDWFIPETGDESFHWEATADAWRMQHHRIKALKDQLKALETEQKALQGSLITLMGQFMQADIGGVKVTRFFKQGSIDYKAFLKEKFPDEDFTDDLEGFRKLSREEARFSRSEDELVNRDVSEVITTVKSAYF